MRNSLILTGLTLRTFSAAVSDCFAARSVVQRALADQVAVEGRRPRGHLEGRAHARARSDRVGNVFDDFCVPGADSGPLLAGQRRCSASTPVAGAPVVLVNVTVVSCDDPGVNVCSPGGVAVADAGARLTACHAIVRSHNVGLHQLVGRVGREGACRRHRALIEGALRAVAVVAAVAQQDRALLAHRVIAWR